MIKHTDFIYGYVCLKPFRPTRQILIYYSFFLSASIRSASTNCEVFNMPANPSCGIPVVDFSAMSLDVKDPDLSSQAVKDLANQVYQAFSTIGVVYITNYGIPQETASLSCSSQWADPGEGPGGPGTPSLVLKNLLRPPSPPPLSEGLDQPLLITSCKNYRVDRTQLNLYFTVVSLRDTKGIRFTF